jgi:hypothetical protein
MSGFGKGKFGKGAFGHWDWANEVIVDSLPDSYYQADLASGGYLVSFLEGVSAPIGKFKRKIDTYDDLRNPLTVISENYQLRVTISKVEDLYDGTARVFLDELEPGTVFENIKPGHILVDAVGKEFVVEEVNSATQASEVTDPPYDPYRDQDSGKHIVVKVSAESSKTVLPAAFGIPFTKSITGVNGTASPPYSDTLTHIPLATNPVLVEWQESGPVDKSGYILPDGNISGDLRVGTTLNFETGVINVVTPGVALSASMTASYDTTRETAASVTFVGVPPTTVFGLDLLGYTYSFTAGINPIPAGDLLVIWEVSGVTKFGYFDKNDEPNGDLIGPTDIYTQYASSINRETGMVVVALQDAPDLGKIYLIYDTAYLKQPHLLDFLAQDYGVTLDRDQPEDRQRSFVYNASTLWGLKGTADGYRVMAALHGHNALAYAMYRVNLGNYNSVPEGYKFILSYTEKLTSLHTAGEGPPYVLTALNFPIGDVPVIVEWEESGVPKVGYIDHDDNVWGDLDETSSVDRTTGVVTIVTAADADADTLFAYIDGWFYSVLPPSKILYDDVIADVIPTDIFCWDTDDIPSITISPVVITSVTLDREELNYSVYTLEVTTSAPRHMFGTEGTIDGFTILEYERVSDTSFTLSVKGVTTPTAGSVSLIWNVIYTDVVVTAVTDLGASGTGTAHRFRVRITSADFIIATPDNWIFIDNKQQHSYIEAFTQINSTTLDIEVVCDETPPTTTGSLYYNCAVTPSCDFCQASFVKIDIYPTPVDDIARAKVERALTSMVPAHVEVAFGYLSLSGGFPPLDGVGGTGDSEEVPPEDQ